MLENKEKNGKRKATNMQNISERNKEQKGTKVSSGPVKIRVLTSEDGFRFVLDDLPPKFVWPIHKLATQVKRRTRGLIAASVTPGRYWGVQSSNPADSNWWQAGLLC